MSGALPGLSQYADSSSDDDSDSGKSPNHAASDSVESAHQQSRVLADTNAIRAKAPNATASNRPKRKLPPLVPDSLHQDGIYGSAESSSSQAGNCKKRVARGDWLCYCFVEVPVEPSLSRLIQESHEYLQSKLGHSHTLLDLRSCGSSCDTGEIDSPVEASGSKSKSNVRLHISLTRPFTVRGYERDEYLKVSAAEIHKLKTTIGSFMFSFSRIAYLANDDASRHFMVLEVGSAQEKFHKVSTALSTELRRAFRAKSYYEEAHFHASTACLTSPAVDEGRAGKEAEEALGPRFTGIIAEAETKWGSQLRKCPPIWATRIGIQVANRITYVEL